MKHDCADARWLIHAEHRYPIVTAVPCFPYPARTRPPEHGPWGLRINRDRRTPARPDGGSMINFATICLTVRDPLRTLKLPRGEADCPVAFGEGFHHATQVDLSRLG